MRKQGFMDSPRFSQLSAGEKQAIADYYKAKFYEQLEQLEIEKMHGLQEEMPCEQSTPNAPSEPERNSPPQQTHMPETRLSHDLRVPERLYSFLMRRRKGMGTLKVIAWFYKVQRDNGVSATKTVICQEAKVAFETATKALDTLKKLNVIKEVAPYYYEISDASQWKLT